MSNYNEYDNCDNSRIPFEPLQTNRNVGKFWLFTLYRQYRLFLQNVQGYEPALRGLQPGERPEVKEETPKFRMVYDVG